MLAGAELDGRVLDGRYELRGIIGEGSFGRVYRGRDRRLARSVAVKVIKPWWAEDGASIERFQDEAQLLARVNDPGIVQIYDFGHTPEGPYYVAELVEGESLEERLRRGPIPAAEAARIAEQLCGALGSAHSRGVVHCDVKPANVLLGHDGRVKVGDFGVARIGEAKPGESSSLFGGTPRYMSPEQARGRSLTPASDVYSAGVVLYEMLAGEPPFQAASAVELGISHLQEVPPELAPQVPAALREIVGVALAKHPGERYRDGAVMAAALRAARDSMHDPGASTVKRAPLSSREPAQPPGRANATIAVGPRTGSGTVVLGHKDSIPSATVARPPKDATAGATVARPRPDATAAGTIAMPRRRPPGTPVRRRRRGLWLALALLLAAAAGTLLLLGGKGRTSVPPLQGLHRASVLARTERAHVHAVFATHYSHAPTGVAIAETPVSGTRVKQGSNVHVLMSAGPPPVAVPDTVGESASEAEAAISGAGLRYALHPVSAPGHAAESVLAQSPSAASAARSGSTVTLTVATAPRWRALTSFSGVDDGQSVPFSIRGHRWRLAYSMSYLHRCFFFVVCEGPSASVEDLEGSSSAGEFELDEGSGTHYHVFDSGPGLYRVVVSGGHDPARWSATVEDASDDGWEQAVAGCDYVLHVASPFPAAQPKDPDELIVPAREGTLRVLRAALSAGVRRVVVTSSVAAVRNFAGPPTDRPLTEEDWSDPDLPGLSPYARSKTIAERAAWDLARELGDTERLAVVNPSAILGPVMNAHRSSSVQLVERLLAGMPGMPRLSFSVVDVRDVAELHLLAMTSPEAAGQRFLAVGPSLWISEMAKILREQMGEGAEKVPRRTFPDAFVRLAARFDPGLRSFTSDLGKQIVLSNEKAKQRLGWNPRPVQETLVECAESLIAQREPAPAAV